MLEELKKLKPFRRVDLFFFLKIVSENQPISIRDLEVIYRHAPNDYILDVYSLIKYCSIFELIIFEQDNKIKLIPDVVDKLDNQEKLNFYIVKSIVNKLFAEGIIQETFFSYDNFAHQYKFKSEQLSLSLSGIRNILVNLGFFELDRKSKITKFLIGTPYEPVLALHCRKKKHSISLNQLQKILEENREAGELAEAFVFEFEKKRICNRALQSKIKIISDIDVCAGYDIISFSSSCARDYDRFIEVKAFSSLGFYWSRNEIEVAKLKSSEYYLYLVDLTQVNNPLYVPFMIQDPFNEIFTSVDWLAEAQSYHVRNVGNS